MKNISVNYSETHYYKLKFHIDIEILRKLVESGKILEVSDFNSYID